MACTRYICLLALLTLCIAYSNAGFPDFIEENGLNINGSNVCKHPMSREKNVTILVQRTINQTYWGTCYKKVWFAWFGWKTFTKSCPMYRLIEVKTNETMTKTYHGHTLKCCLHWKKIKHEDTECKKPICMNGCGHGKCIAAGTCKCDPGWQGYTCNQDVNECYDQNGGCQQECYNKRGSYECVCRKGYRRDTNDPTKCIGFPDFIEDNGLNINGSNVCKHPMSREKNITTLVQRTINQTYWGTCYQKVWFAWFGWKTFTKSCPMYRLIVVKTNETMTKTYHGYSLKCCLHWEKIKHEDTECKKPICMNGCGHGKFIAGDTCKCDPGWKGYTCNQDINECYDHSGGCQQYCYNKRGSYECVCRKGYRRDTNDPTKCIDINECQASKPKCVCAEKGDPQCKASCTNTIGGFKCHCSKGYRLNWLYTCMDVDECLSANDCTQNCINTPGSYKCDCFKGLAYVKANNMCEDINECKVQNNGGCEQDCLNSYSSYRCRCKLGYRLAPDRKKCIKYQVPDFG